MREVVTRSTNVDVQVSLGQRTRNGSAADVMALSIGQQNSEMLLVADKRRLGLIANRGLGDKVDLLLHGVDGRSLNVRYIVT